MDQYVGSYGVSFTDVMNKTFDWWLHPVKLCVLYNIKGWKTLKYHSKNAFPQKSCNNAYVSHIV